jgi:N-acetylglucosamine malate deacetylase 1
MMPKLDVLALAAHPDDVELCAGGTMCLLHKQGYRTGVVDFTQGELGTRGTPELRMQEADAAAKVMGLAVRENLSIPDGGIENTAENRVKVIRAVRRHRPHIVLLNPPECRHPDHEHASRLGTEAMFYAGLKKIETFEDDGTPQEPWRPHHVLYYMQTIPFNPTLVVDVSEVWEQRVEALLAFRSQFYNADYQAGKDEPDTFVSNPDFFKSIEGRARSYGYMIGATYGEPFRYRQGPFGTDDLVSLLAREKQFR